MAKLIVKAKTLAPLTTVYDETKTITVKIGNVVNSSGGASGKRGDSAYVVAVKNGFIGTESEWLESLKGQDGVDGLNGIDGQNGVDGKDGAKGDKGDKGDAFVYADFTTEQLALLKGEQGLRGEQGVDGAKGEQGDKGVDGQDGLSAYQVAVSNGFVGSEPDWLLSLVGADGQNGTDGQQGIQGERGLKGDKGDPFTYSDFTPEQLTALKGEKGEKGDTGLKGDAGADGLDGKDGIDGTDATVVIAQTMGQSTTEVVSQKLFTDTVGGINLVLDAINGEVV